MVFLKNTFLEEKEARAARAERKKGGVFEQFIASFGKAKICSWSLQRVWHLAFSFD